jgi:crossover junction endodeoxyribonuclease RuvC
MANSKKKSPILPALTCPLSNKSRVLGLDLSLTGTGWYEYNKPDPEHAMETYLDASGLIETKKMIGLDRIHFILTEVMKLVNKQTLIIVEDFSFGSKGSALFQIAGLGYIVRHELWSQGIDFILVPPTVLKKFVTGAGNSDKSVMLKEIYKRWQADINDDNIGDAYGLCRIGRAILEWDTELIGFQKDALKQLNKEE